MSTFVVGEVAAIRKREPGLVVEDNFNNGPSGWTQLMTETNPTGPVVLDSEITYDNSRYSLLVGTEDYTNIPNRPWGGAMAIKRMGRPDGITKAYMEMQWAWGSLHGITAPRAIDFGLDQATKTGQRSFFRVRWLNFDESTGARVAKWQIQDTTGFIDVPGASIDVGLNENKRNLCKLEMVFNVATNKYDGLRVNGIGFGSLAPTPDASLSAYGPAVSSLPTFANGFNPVLEIRNRTDTSNTKCWVNLAYAKVVAL